MKIAILTPTFSAFSGIDRVVELQAEEFIDRGDEVTIFCLKAGMKPKRAKLVEIGMPKSQFWERVYRLFFFFDRSKIKKYGKILKNYDLIVSHFYPMNLLGVEAKNKYKVKWVYHNHGVATPGLFENFHERIYMKMFNFFSNYTIKKATYAVSISDYLRRVLKKETGMNSKVIYDKIDKKRFNKKISGNKIRKKYRIKKESVCLYVGRISPNKGIDLLIRSFNWVLKEKPNSKLIIVGKETFSDYNKKLKKLAKRVNRNNIIFTGFVPDEELPHYYSSCDVYTTTTLWEGFNLPIVEAQACGKPVVAFDVGPNKEVMDKKGILVKRRDILGFSKAILKQISN